jgi:hypothetical protein
MTLRKRTLALLIAAALTPQFAATAHAQSPAYAPQPAQAPSRVYTQAELDQMLAPIALYPDALLSQVLMAATYPIEVVEAARWTRANPGLRGDAAVRAVQNQDWDPSVQSLVAFPHILQRMDENLQWTEDLGEAFLAQESALMDSVQELRQRAYAAGHLRSTDQIHVVQQGPVIYVRPARPEVVYVPYYDPLVVYGDWRWPAYRPVVWAPWPGYARPRPGVSIGFWFGSPVSLSANFFYGDFDWGRRSVRVVRPTAYYYRPPRVIVNNTTIINRNVTVDRSRWQHDPHHRRGVAYRQPEVRQRFAAAQTERREEQREARRDERGLERRGERREAQQPEQRQAQPPQARPEQTRPERRETRDDQQRQRREAQGVERSQLQQQREQREQTQAAERAQRQQRDQAQAAERAQRHQQRQQAESARAQQQRQRQQAESARAQQQQQRQQAEAARAQQQQARQQQRQEQRSAMPAAQAPQAPRAERHERREERREQRQERGQKS